MRRFKQTTVEFTGLTSSILGDCLQQAAIGGGSSDDVAVGHHGKFRRFCGTV